MRRPGLTVIPLLLLAACLASPQVLADRHLGETSVQSKTKTDRPRPALATPAPTATSTPVQVPTESSPAFPDEFAAIFHPDGSLYVGDQVSIEVVAPEAFDPSGKSVAVLANGEDLGTAALNPFGIAGRQEAVFTWAWGTSALEPGDYRLDFSVLPAGPQWSETVTLLPAADLPPPGEAAGWEILSTACCEISYITGTEAERDIEALGQIADSQADAVQEKLGAQLTEKIPLVLMSRVLGHGGFTSDAIYVSYLDRNYAGEATAQVLHHEVVHWLDGKQGGDLRPTILVEGLAVYLSGGHFKPEALLPRAAAVRDLGWYIPLRQLTDDFYPSQHEIGYIEAGALVQYLVETHGWAAFDAFYRDIHPSPSGQQSDALDGALQAHFDISLEQLEADWIDWLEALPEDPTARQDVVQTVRFYATVRRYQVMFDSSAYFQTAWLPDETQMREKGIVADYLRHPDGPMSRYLETLLVQADASLRAGNYGLAGHILGVVNSLLNVVVSLN